MNTQEIITLMIMAIIVALLVYLVQRHFYKKALKTALEIANAKLEIQEREMAKKEARLDSRHKELEAKARQKIRELEREYESAKTLSREDAKELDALRADLLERRSLLEANIAEYTEAKERYLSASKQSVKLLSDYTHLTLDEAREELLNRLDEHLVDEKARIIHHAIYEAEHEAKERASYIIAQATTRYASSFASKNLCSVVTLENDDLKGRIIGKEGRNIRALELISGVDVIIDDTPNSIIISSFNLYRRAMAVRTLELLIEDGRIQPARIEEIYNSVKNEMEYSVQKEGEEVAFSLGLSGFHPEILKLIGKLRYRASFGQNALAHAIEVAKLAGVMASELGGDLKLARRAGIMHDIGKALTQEVGGSHIDLGEKIAKKYGEGDVVLNTILAHHGHEEIKSIECACVCAADTLSGARPGARLEMLENFLHRMQELENIAKSKFGVLNAYAIDAGRELRVIVKASALSDSELITLSEQIRQDVEKQVHYQGEVKITVIRETRVVTIAS